MVEVLSPTKPSSPAAQIEVERKFQVIFEVFFLQKIAVKCVEKSHKKPRKNFSTAVINDILKVPKDFREALPAQGYELVKGFAEETIVDEYFDTRRLDLIRADHWLRRRNGDWEMK